MGQSQTRNQCLAFIHIKSQNPFDLFREWHTEAKTFSTGMPNAFCLATVSKDLNVSARYLILRRLDTDGFVFITDSRSKKSHDLMEVPNASICFLWSYLNDQQEHVLRQVRIDGFVERLHPDQYVEIYNKEPLNFKIRSFLGPQGKEVNWEEQLMHFHQIRDEVDKGRSLPMPENLVGYKLYPRKMEFYYSYNDLIADRVLFLRDPSSGLWTNCRLAA